MSEKLFQNKVVIVTGGSTGIGHAASLLFAENGAKVVVSDVNIVAGEDVVAKIKSSGGDALFVKCDVSNRDDIKAMVAKTVEHFGRLDTAFNNAGICLDADNDWDDAVFDKTMAVNAMGVMSCMKAEIPEMLKVGGGTIVNTASTTAFVTSGLPSQPAYTASKHAVVGMTKTAALTYAKQNIRVNALCPGVTFTPIVEQVMALGPEVKATLENYAPMGRMGKPEEMAEAAFWLCSSKASFVTGQTLVVDGGAIIQ